MVNSLFILRAQSPQKTDFSDQPAIIASAPPAPRHPPPTAGTGLTCELSYHDVFHHCENDADAVALLRRAMDDEGISHDEGLILRASEDFGLFGRKAKSAMFYFGAGEDSPQLHNPDYDFPDALIEPATRIFLRTVRNLLG